MKKQFLLFGFSVLAVIGLTAYIMNGFGTGEFQLENKNTKGESSINKAQSIKEAMEDRMNRLRDENGNFYNSYYANAIKQADQFHQNGSRSGLGLHWEELGPDNVGGRTRAILIDKRDASHNTVYAGGIGGGMWKSTDGANTWTRLNGWNQWLAVSCITQGPGPDYTIYIGTGEGLAQIGGSSFNSGSMGNGIFKLDANDNPVQLTTPDVLAGSSLANGSQWAAVNRIAVNPMDGTQIIAATQGGLYQSNDGGTTWTHITSAGLNNSSAADVKWSSDGVNIYAAANGNNYIFISLNGGFSWAKVSASANPGFPATQGRIELAVAPSDPNTVYAAIATTMGATYGVYKSSDAGAHWASIGNKGPLFDPFTAENQGWYDNVIAVSPADPNKVYMGGVNFYTWSDQAGWKLADAGLGAGEQNPNYIHPDKHAITICNDDANLMYVGCDGGVYKSVSAISKFPYPEFSVKNRGYNVTQNYSVAAAISGEVMGGAQDNGTNYINFLGNTTKAAKMVIGGDGIYADISHIDPRIFFGGIYFGEVLRSGNSASSFDNFYDIKIDPQGYTQPSRCGGAKDANAQFITPFYLSETRSAANGITEVKFVADQNYNSGDIITAQSATAKYQFNYQLPSSANQGDTVLVNDPIRSRMCVASNCGVWVTPDALNLGIIPRWFRLILSMSGLPESFCSSTDGDVMYVGTNGGRVYRFPNFNAHCDTTSYPIGPNAVGILYTNSTQYTFSTPASGRSIEGIAVDPADNNHIVAAVAGFSSSNQPHVYESHNGGTTWTALTSGLPNMPVYDVVIHDANTIIIGSELGIWSWDGSQWNEENDAYLQQGGSGLPRVPVYRLIEKELYNESCKVLYIGTHGRGMWRCTTLTAGGCQTVASVNDAKNTASINDLNIYPNPVNSTSKISLTLDKKAEVTLRVLDMTGRLYKEVTVKNATAGENLFDLDAAGLSNGTYLLAATVGNVRTQSRLFVVAK